MPAKKLFPNLAKSEPKGNVFTSIFDDNLAKQQEKSDVVNSVMKKTDTTSVLGPKPKVDSLNIVEKPSHFGGSFLKLTVFLWFLLLIGSYLTMGASFNPIGLNIKVESDSTVESLKQAQAELNTNNYTVAYEYLDSFSFIADSYLNKKNQYESVYTTSIEKNSLESDIEDLYEDLALALSMAQDKLDEETSPVGIEIHSDGTLTSEYVFKDATISYIEGKLAESDDPALKGALALFRNGAFVKELIAMDTSSEMSDETIESLVSKLSSITEDNFTIISKIKSERQEWSDIITEIDEITKQVDPLYNSAIESDISYSSYNFDSKNKTISLDGVTKTDDTRNFTLIANLLDALEESTLFMDVTERAFNKSSSGDEGYEAQFRVEFKIQEGEDSRDKQVSIAEELEETEEEEVKVSVDEPADEPVSEE